MTIKNSFSLDMLGKDKQFYIINTKLQCLHFDGKDGISKLIPYNVNTCQLFNFMQQGRYEGIISNPSEIDGYVIENDTIPFFKKGTRFSKYNAIYKDAERYRYDNDFFNIVLNNNGKYINKNYKPEDFIETDFTIRFKVNKLVKSGREETWKELHWIGYKQDVKVNFKEQHVKGIGRVNYKYGDCGSRFRSYKCRRRGTGFETEQDEMFTFTVPVYKTVWKKLYGIVETVKETKPEYNTFKSERKIRYNNSSDMIKFSLDDSKLSIIENGNTKSLNNTYKWYIVSKDSIDRFIEIVSKPRSRYVAIKEFKKSISDDVKRFKKNKN